MNEYLEFAIKIAKKSGKKVMEYYNSSKNLNYEYKDDNSIVSLADIESERLINDSIKKHYPDHSIIGEETGASIQESDYTWCVDPLDGSTNFSIHYPFFSISIALLYKNRPIVGVVYFPPQDELYYASENGGAFLNDKKINVSKEDALSRAIIAFSNSREESDLRLISQLFLEFRLLKQKLRHFGSAALELCYVAAGRIEAFIGLGVNIWDVAAGILLIKEAGGKITDFKGDKFILDRKNKTLLASNNRIHNNLLNFINNTLEKYNYKNF